MQGRDTPREPRTLPPKLRRLIALDRLALSEPGALKLTPGEVAALKDLVSGGSARPSDVSVARGISALALRDRSAETATLLARFVADEREAPVDRAVAATSLRLIPLGEARTGLIRNLTVAEQIVRLEAIKSLGCIGDEDALVALDKLPWVEPGPEQRQLAFSKALIAHRVGLARDDMPFRQGVARKPGPADALIPLSLRPMRVHAIVAERELLRGSDYGIPLSGKVGFSLRAGKARWTVFVNGELTEDGVFARSSKVFERPWITALLARFDERTQSTSVQHIVLTDPVGNGATIMVVRTDGELFYSGRLTRPRGLLSFVVRDVARKGTAPTNVKGRLTTRGVEFEMSVPFGQRRNPRTGEAVVA
jgi:hypothetical protein